MKQHDGNVDISKLLTILFLYFQSCLKCGELCGGLGNPGEYFRFGPFIADNRFEIFEVIEWYQLPNAHSDDSIPRKSHPWPILGSILLFSFGIHSHPKAQMTRAPSWFRLCIPAYMRVGVQLTRMVA